jgi:hypothetical protein
MLSDHCDSAHRVTVGCADLFWASVVVIFWAIFFWFMKPNNYVPLIMRIIEVN